MAWEASSLVLLCNQKNIYSVKLNSERHYQVVMFVAITDNKSRCDPFTDVQWQDTGGKIVWEASSPIVLCN